MTVVATAAERPALVTASATTGSRVLIIQGHPDASRPHLCHALADRYAAGAHEGGHEVRRIEVTAIGLPFLTSPDEWEQGTPSTAVRACQDDIAWARHLVIIYPLWLGGMPAQLKGFLEQVFRPGFAVPQGASPLSGKPLKGRSARVVVTMGMPAPLFRWYFGAHSLKSLERSILGFCGIGPVRSTLFGLVGSGSDRKRRRWLETMHRLGRGAD